MGRMKAWAVAAIVAGIAGAEPSAWAKCRFIRDKSVLDPVQWRCCDGSIDNDLKGWCTGLPAAGATAISEPVQDRQGALWFGGKVKNYAKGEAGNLCAKDDQGKGMVLAFHCDKAPANSREEAAPVSDAPSDPSDPPVPDSKPEVVLNSCVWANSSDASFDFASTRPETRSRKLIQLPKEYCGGNAPTYVCIGKVDCDVRRPDDGGDPSQQQLTVACKVGAATHTAGGDVYQCPDPLSCAQDKGIALDQTTPGLSWSGTGLPATGAGEAK